MNELAQFCRNLKKDFTPRTKDPKKLVGCWSEKDVLDNKIVDAFVIIFRTKGCSWALESGCSMCGYFNDSMWDEVSDNDLLTQFDTAMNKYSGQKFVKIFTSGSFLDDEEVRSKVRKQILSKLAETADKVSVESRPEYITDKKISEIKKNFKSKIFEVGVGLETANDITRERCLNKGFTFDDYKKAVKTLKKYSVKLKTYILVKPPFLTEKESLEDAINTVEKIKKITDTISFNPTNVQRNTLVNYLWQRKKYRPPWLFSIVEILKESKKIAPDVLIKCDIAGGGGIRGAHNCKDCDRQYIKAIEDFSLNQDIKVFQDLDCDCKDKWLDLLDIEGLTFGSINDI
ncbi:MAG: archaeosine biosynthesis radical SAM protein RaSEA [Thermoplasmatales archaeon]|nr:archaeosine biosynthesis radical SAM protein RaSEA [Thermoplasmatales archaeon]